MAITNAAKCGKAFVVVNIGQQKMLAACLQSRCLCPDTQFGNGNAICYVNKEFIAKNFIKR